MALDIQLWTEAGVKEALSGGYATSEGGEEFIVLPADTAPADGGEAARRYFGTDAIEFSHLGMGAYPIYKKAKV